MDENQLEAFKSYLRQKYPSMSADQTKQIDDFVNTQKITTRVQADPTLLNTLSPTQREKILPNLPAGFETKSRKEGEAEDARAKIKKEAEGLLNVIALGKSGVLVGKDFESALNYAASQYNLAGSEARGKNLTGPELAILAGAIIRQEQPRTQNVFERITGQQPAPTGKLIDDISTIERKALLASGKLPTEASRSSSYAPEQQEQRQTSNKSLQGFLQNLSTDVGENVSGITSLPGVLLEILQGKRSLPETAGQVGQGIVQEYVDLVSNPIEQAYNKPLSTTLDILPFLQAGKAAYAGKAGKVGKAGDVLADVGKVGKVTEGATAVEKVLQKANKADKLGKVGKVTEGATAVEKVLQKANKADKLGKVGKVTEGATAVERVLQKANKADKLTKVGNLERGIYQGILRIPKADKAFQILKPSETVDSMIRYGIKGNYDDLASKASRVTGDKGILTGVVDNAIADVAGKGNIGKVFEVIEETKTGGKYSKIPEVEFQKLSERVNRIPQSGGVGDVDLAAILDEERKLQSEGFRQMSDGKRVGDLQVEELGRFKLELADELGGIIDSNVKNAKVLDKYKDPKILAELKKVSPKLADDFKNAKTLSEVRTLQKDFVRFKKLLDLTGQQGASASSGLFGRLQDIPVLGDIVQSASENLAAPVSTNVAVGLNNLPKPLRDLILGYGRRPIDYNIARQTREEAYPY